MSEAASMDRIKLTKPPAHVRAIDDVLRWLRVGGRSTRLDLGYPSDWTTRDIQALATSPFLPRLQALALHGSIGVEGAHALARCSRLDHLTHLRLGASLDEDGLQVLVDSPHLARLTYLDLHNDSGHRVRGLVGSRGPEALVASSSLQRLKILDLSWNSLGDTGVEALATTPHLATLERLSLRACSVGDAGAYALAASPYLGSLTLLDLRDNVIGAKAERALTKSVGLARAILLL